MTGLSWPVPTVQPIPESFLTYCNCLTAITFHSCRNASLENRVHRSCLCDITFALAVSKQSSCAFWTTNSARARQICQNARLPQLPARVRWRPDWIHRVFFHRQAHHTQTATCATRVRSLPLVWSCSCMNPAVPFYLQSRSFYENWCRTEAALRLFLYPRRMREIKSNVKTGNTQSALFSFIDLCFQLSKMPWGPFVFTQESKRHQWRSLVSTETLSALANRIAGVVHAWHSYRLGFSPV